MPFISTANGIIVPTGVPEGATRGVPTRRPIWPVLVSAQATTKGGQTPPMILGMKDGCFMRD